MNKAIYIAVFCLLVMIGCTKAQIKSDSNGMYSSADKKSHVKKENLVPISKEVLDTIKNYLQANDPAENREIVNVFRYGSIDPKTDIYIAFFAVYGEAHTLIGGYDLSAFIVSTNGEVKEYEQSFASITALYQTDDDKKNYEKFPGIILPYGSCYDFDGDGNDEIAVLNYGFGSAAIGTLTFYRFGKKNNDDDLNTMYASCEIEYWDVEDYIPHPVQWVTYKGREGFKVYYRADGAEWPKDKSLPKPWFVGWNEKTKQFEPLEEMNE